MKVLITGSSGYIGKQLLAYLSKKKLLKVTILTRNKNIKINNDINVISYNKLSELNLYDIFKNIDCIIHLIAKQHETSKSKKINYNDYYYTNVEILNKFILVAKKTNIKKIILTSTIKVFGEYTLKDQSFNVLSKFNPRTNYSKTKLIAENQLIYNLKNSHIKYTIIRLPLVYGFEAKGNFKNLIKLINLNFPLPFKNINNVKSLLHMNNLLDFIYIAINSDLSNNKIFNICDDKNFSTSEIVRIIINKFNKKNILFYFPHTLITKLVSFFLNDNQFVKIFFSLKVDNQNAKKILKWKPKLNFDDL